ncbi:alpha/beta hydrolase [Erythrobacter litoralis]|uniref:alpha/beta hydrolase n=1 Tax=Erythrobacter litoralis TaxID=39960 RepID=UPI002434F76E|nr:alpha/beta hydrolase-fold protein [Erythrobacter litoralis]MDG6077652.1 alpha/beta hydrolase [Erythrobacter litoralis]
MRYLVAAATLLFASTGATAQMEGGEPLAIGTIYTIESDILEGGKRKITVRLPAEYVNEPDRRFPVVYLLDGGPEQDFAHIAGIAQSREMNYSFEPFILVGIQSVNRRHELAPPVVDPAPYEEALQATPGGSPDYRRFLRKELKSMIEAQYRTDGHDAVMGESLAGLFVIETLLEDPTLFDDYIAISPSMWWEQMKYGREAADYFAAAPTGERRLYLTSATEGAWHREGTERLIAALRNAAPKGLQWTFVEGADSETHGTIYHPMALDAFRALYGTPSREYKNYPLIGGPPIVERTPEEQALLDTECTQENSIRMTPATSEHAREALYYRCLLLDLGPTPREGNLGD